MTIEPLKPCPFCGGLAHVSPEQGPWSALCVACRAEGPVAETPLGATEAWNKRTAPPSRPVEDDGYDGVAFVESFKAHLDEDWLTYALTIDNRP